MFFQNTPILALHQRPVRKRRPIKTLREEQQDEHDRKQQRSLLRQHKRPRRLLRLFVEKKHPTFSPTPKKATVKQKLKSTKRKSNEISPPELKRPTKTARSEVGGAGTLKHKRKVIYLV